MVERKALGRGGSSPSLGPRFPPKYEAALPDWLIGVGPPLIRRFRARTWMDGSWPEPFPVRGVQGSTRPQESSSEESLGITTDRPAGQEMVGASEGKWSGGVERGSRRLIRGFES
jgi:hypothetical protein